MKIHEFRSNKITPEQVLSLLMCNGNSMVRLPDGRLAIFSGVAREDGGGKNFLLQLDFKGKKEEFFVRLVDAT